MITSPASVPAQAEMWTDSATSTSRLRGIHGRHARFDVLDAATKLLVWRGTAQAEVLPAVDVSTREARIREAVRRILERFPPKS